MTAEEIAREAAEGFARVKVHPDGMASVYVGTVCVRGRMDGAATAGAFADAVTYAVRTLVVAAVERALREVPVPGALGEREVAGVLGVMAYLDDAVGADAPVLAPRQVREIRDAFASVCADNDHLRRAMHDCGQDGTADVWAGGYEAGKAAGHREGFAEGAKAQRDAAVARAVARTDQYDGAEWDSANAVTVDVYDSPLVTPSEE